METWWQIAIGLLALWLVFLFVRSVFRRRPSDAVEDPLAGVPATRKRGPGSRSGAVALAEPDEEGEDGSSTPPNL